MKRQRSARTPFPRPSDPEVHASPPRAVMGRRALLMGIPALSATGCVGTFSLLRHFSQWNLQIHESKWVNWLIFLAFVIIPVYELILLVDFLVINSIEFWTEEDPIDWEVRNETDDGGEAIVRRTDDPDVLEWSYAKGGETRLTLYVERNRENGSLRLLDEKRGQISRLAVGSEAELRDHRDGRVAHLSIRQLRRAARAGEEQGLAGAMAAIHAAVEDNGESERVLAMTDRARRFAAM